MAVTMENRKHEISSRKNADNSVNESNTNADPNVLMVLSSFYPEIAGRNDKMREIANLLNRNGFQVYVLTPSRTRYKPYRVDQSVVFPIYFNPHRILRSLDYRLFHMLLGYPIVALPRALRIVAKLRIDILYSPNFPWYPHFLSYLIKIYFAKGNIKWIADIRDPILDHPQLPKWGYQRIAAKFIERMVALHADNILICKGYALNKALFDSRYRYCSDRSVQMPYLGIDVEPYRDFSAFTDNERFTITYTGSIPPSKNVYDNFRAFMVSFKKFIHSNNLSPAQTSFVYAGNLGEEVKRLAEESNLQNYVVCLGWLCQKELIKTQKNSSILLIIQDTHKSSADYIYSKVWEYIAAERPILAIGCPSGTLYQMIQKNNLGLCTQEDLSIERALTRFYTNYVSNNLALQIDGDFVQSISRQHYLFKLLHVFNDIL